MIYNIFIAAVSVAIGVLFGWLLAHNEVATECQRQGGFYVGSKDFKCEVIQK
jgi:hypothetical protein